MTSELEDETKQILHNISSENEFSIDHVEIGLDDHIHLLVSAPLKISVTVIVKCLKGTSSFRLFRKYPELRRFFLEYKLQDRGKYFVKVDKWFPSSQICHQCVTIHKRMKDLSIRTMKCDCGLTISRDQNAAINIKNEGLRILKSA